MVFQMISRNYLNIVMAQQLLQFFKISFAASASVSSNSLPLYSKDLKILLLAIPASKLVASSLE